MGHWNTSMFGKLMKYKEQGYYSKHKDIYLYTPEKNSKYRIVNVLKTTSSSKWYQFTSLSSSEISLDELKESLKAGALYECNGVKEHSNKFITLSTCDYDGNYRILVVGERTS